MIGDAIEGRLRELLTIELGYSIREGGLGDETPLYGKGLGVNSIDVMELIVRLEGEFEVIFEDDEIPECIETFGSLVQRLRQKLAQGPAPPTAEGI